MTKARIGVIGGSGLYEIEGLRVVEEVEVETPFGRPSDVITIGELAGQRIAFLPRAGAPHPAGGGTQPGKRLCPQAARRRATHRGERRRLDAGGNPPA